MPSSMIVFPEPAVAQHTEVYGSKSKPEVVIQKFLKFWESAYHSFKKHMQMLIIQLSFSF